MCLNEILNEKAKQKINSYTNDYATALRRHLGIYEVFAKVSMNTLRLPSTQMSNTDRLLISYVH